MILFMIGTASVINPGLPAAKRDMWISAIIAATAAFLLALMCARLHYIMPKKDLFNMLDFCFGKFLGKCLYIIYFLFFFSCSIISINGCYRIY